MHDQRAIRTAWEVFLSEGRLLPGPDAFDTIMAILKARLETRARPAP